MNICNTKSGYNPAELERHKWPDKSEHLRQRGTNLLRNGNYMGAFDLNATRIQATYGVKYNQAIEQARKTYQENIITVCVGSPYFSASCS